MALVRTGKAEDTDRVSPAIEGQPTRHISQ
ncbi:hypothetical protein SNOG_10735 [Parastagonospora nodorum SN15]|uniref:Uncharacterized protein n=1 Tax=Phaeosphaeria nodorum (strain SN15 / ATCC MYA-4574 / FGSC 10173) TaxID=321614 RepID=Q0UBX9_PHANO|nr:hypothetical protein SNOG_10735 [Parastagonospora nodorum SN15]EAT82129.1 hypothetical protein SNOG_10735 [Parastagonospora nodorum SN15]